MTPAEFLRGVWAELAKSPGFLALVLLVWLAMAVAIVFAELAL